MGFTSAPAIGRFRVIEISVTEDMVSRARVIAEARLNDQSRRLSPDRPTARNIDSQIRGALGEIVAEMWMVSKLFPVESGFEADKVSDTDLTVNDIGVEVMTAKVGDRLKTGFCVPPNKLAAARSRGAWGYLFVGSDNLAPPSTMWIQGAVRTEHVDSVPARHTYVNSPRFSVLNFVIEENYLLTPEQFLRQIGRR